MTQAISGVYRFEAYSDKNALLVLSKTEESFAFLDSIIDSLDQPSDVGLPKIVELKHANAVALTQELNALLSAPGVTATIAEPDTGLSGEGFGESATSTDNETGGQMSFPWQQGGANADDQSAGIIAHFKNSTCTNCEAKRNRDTCSSRIYASDCRCHCKF